MSSNESNTGGNPAVYLDNNSTTAMPRAVIEEMIRWVNKGNPSSSYSSAVECKDLIKEFKKYLAETCNFTIYEQGAALDTDYEVIFNSGASESNCYILKAVVDSYRYRLGKIPHIITSSIEHKSLIDCAINLADRGYCQLSVVKPDALGFITPSSVKRAILKNTALICIMAANNETGAINNIAEIAKIAHKTNIALYSDFVQMFGKGAPDVKKLDIDVFGMSFHKIHGPPGIGALFIRKKFMDGYKLAPEIHGSQNSGMRGGTENISLIAAAYKATRITLDDRKVKNAKLLDMKRSIIRKLPKYIESSTYREYLENERRSEPRRKSIELVFISTAESTYLCNTLLFSVVKRIGEPMCNVKLKDKLENRGVIVSVGSACNTSNASASHVVKSMGVDPFIMRGLIRVSLGDTNDNKDVERFISALILSIKEMVDEEK